MNCLHFSEDDRIERFHDFSRTHNLIFCSNELFSQWFSINLTNVFFNLSHCKSRIISTTTSVGIGNDEINKTIHCKLWTVAPGIKALKKELLRRNRRWQTFSLKSQKANGLGFVGHTISDASTWHCLSSLKAAIDNKWMGVATFSMKFYLQKQVRGWIWPLAVVWWPLL